jgi:uncharacterized protein (DUF2249 family)
MAARAATSQDFEKMPLPDRERYASVLRVLDNLRLGCRVEMIDGKDFTITIGKGYATAKFWLDNFSLT